MHELSVTESLLALALEKANEAGATRINRINLIIGEMSGIVSDCVQFYFDVISRETIARGAELSFEKVPVRVRCRNCRAEFEPRDGDWSCPECRKTAIEIVAGRECHMESIEVE